MSNLYPNVTTVDQATEQFGRGVEDAVSRLMHNSRAVQVFTRTLIARIIQGNYVIEQAKQLFSVETTAKRSTVEILRDLMANIRQRTFGQDLINAVLKDIQETGDEGVCQLVSSAVRG